MRICEWVGIVGGDILVWSKNVRGYEIQYEKIPSNKILLVLLIMLARLKVLLKVVLFLILTNLLQRSQNLKFLDLNIWNAIEKHTSLWELRYLLIDDSIWEDPKQQNLCCFIDNVCTVKNFTKRTSWYVIFDINKFQDLREDLYNLKGKDVRIEAWHWVKKHACPNILIH